MNAPKPDSSPLSRRAKFSGPLITLALVVAIELLAGTALRIPNPPAFLILSIVLSAFVGGLTSGLISAAIAWLYLPYFFSIPGQPFHYTGEDLRRGVVWAFTMPTTALMVGILKRRGERAHEAARSASLQQVEWVERERAAEALRAGQAMFQGLFEAAPDAIVVVNRAGQVVRVNAQAETMFGYRREELHGQPIERLLPERFTQRHVGHRAGYVAEPRTRPMGSGLELFARRKDGREFPVDITLGPLETDEGLLVLSIIRDITERKRAEAALRTSEAMFQALFEFAPDAIVAVNGEGNIVRVNTQAETMFGYRRDELHGQPVEMLLPERFTQRHVGHRAGYMASPRTRAMGAGLELYGRRKDGSEFPVDITLGPLETGESSIVLSIVRDITERKRAEEVLKQTAAELARSNAELEQFAYVASHDLQEPLRAVTGMVQLLRQRYQGKLDARADEFVTHAVEGAARMQALINDLLAFSRVGPRGQPLQPADGSTILTSVLANLAAAIRESHAVVTQGALPTVMADPTQMTQLLQNLISNGIKFRSERPPEIHVGAERSAGEWVFSVRDNGIGIERQYFDRIFGVFQRLHTRREYPGTGIGLAICKKIVERHGGRIWVESEPGQGATFLFTMPDRRQIS